MSEHAPSSDVVPTGELLQAAINYRDLQQRSGLLASTSTSTTRAPALDSSDDRREGDSDVLDALSSLCEASSTPAPLREPEPEPRPKPAPFPPRGMAFGGDAAYSGTILGMAMASAEARSVEAALDAEGTSQGSNILSY